MPDRTLVVGESFYDNFSVFGPDQYNKLAGLSVVQGDFTTEVFFNGVALDPQPPVSIDEPGGDGEYRLHIPPNTLLTPGYVFIEICLPRQRLKLGQTVEVIPNILGLIRTTFGGSVPTKIIVTDQQSAAPLGDTLVQIFDATQQNLVNLGRTHAATGFFELTLDPGAYALVLGRRGTLFANPVAMVVPAQDGLFVVACVGQSLVVAPSGVPGVCRLYGYLRTGMGLPAAEAEVLVEVIGEGAASYVAAQGAINPKPLGIAHGTRQVFADKQSGIWQIDMLQGVQARVRIAAQNLQKDIVVPAQATANLADVAPRPQAAPSPRLTRQAQVPRR